MSIVQTIQGHVSPYITDFMQGFVPLLVQFLTNLVPYAAQGAAQGAAQAAAQAAAAGVGVGGYSSLLMLAQASGLTILGWASYDKHRRQKLARFTAIQLQNYIERTKITRRN